jgi:hypothetical protein
VLVSSLIVGILVGCTNLQTFFSAGFCFLSNERHADYYLASRTSFSRQAYSNHVYL